MKDQWHYDEDDNGGYKTQEFFSMKVLALLFPLVLWPRRFRNSQKAPASEATQTTTKKPTTGVPLAEKPSMAVPTTPTIAIGRHRSPRVMGYQGFVVAVRRAAITRSEDDERRGAGSVPST